jgi:CDP-glycerol glycerophosphotransferase
VAAPRVSVVVPFYNNAETLADCLTSIADQTMTGLEVLMVDDGSTDASPEIARAQAAADPRFTLVQVPHGGSPGYTRNRGIERATAEFLAFVDADDMIPPNAYEILLHTLEKSGSDIVSGNVLRMGQDGYKQSGLHAQAIKARAIGTHITRTPSLLYDISVWNKLFRKKFWDDQELRFPEGVVWEDLQLMTRAHVLARAVDVVTDVIYYWRQRGQGQLSITQSRTNITNLRDRVTAFSNIDAFLAERKLARLLRLHQRKALVNDLWMYVKDLYKVSDAYQQEFIDLVDSYLAQVRRPVFRTLPATHKLAYHLARVRDQARLLELVTWLLEQPVQTIPVVRTLGRLRADLPWRTDRAAHIPGRVYKPYWRDLDPHVQVQSAGWQEGRLVVSGCAYVPSIDIGKRRHASKIVVLRPRTRLRPPVVVRARSVRYPEATALSRQERYSYEWSGFQFELNPRRFRIAGRWLTGDWDAFVLVRGHGVWRPARIHTPVPGPAERPGFFQAAPAVRVRPEWVGRQLHVRVAVTPARLAAVEMDGANLMVEVDCDRPAGASDQPGPDGELILVREGGATTRYFAARHVSSSGPVTRLRASIPVGRLPVSIDPADPANVNPASTPEDSTGDDSTDGDGTAWAVFLKLAGGGRMRVAFPADPADLAEAGYPDGAREVAVSRSRYGDVVITEEPVPAVIEEQAWSAEGRLLLTGRYPAPPGQAAVAMLRHRESSDQHVVPLRRDGERFSLDVDVPALPAFGWRRPLRDGIWDISAETGDGAARPVPLRFDHAGLDRIAPGQAAPGGKLYTFTTTGYDAPILIAEPKLREAELGNYNQRRLRETRYPAQRKLPLRDAVLFASWNGSQCADNPLGIAEELRRRGDRRERVWVVDDWAVPVPAGDTAVLAGTEEYYEALARCRHVISNDGLPGYYHKRDGQIYVQTWHGTPLKKIGFDIERPQFAAGTAYFGHLAQDVAKWDLLLSQNPFSTPIFRRAFRFDGEICEYGYPRNDLLSRDDPAAAARVRERLGLPEGKRVVLYAPTWRDNQFYASGRYRFDLRLDTEQAWRALGEDHVFLIRGHYRLADDVPGGMRPGFAVNVTGYPDISELLLISDVLITDYSAVMFDFARTGKPILLFTYDLDDYRDILRGLNFDLAAEAPGPLLASSGEVIDAVRDVDAVAASYRGRYETFAARYCALDDGKAAARVCDRLFGS